jgi:glucokinase
VGTQALSLDIGGTKIAAAIVDAHGRVGARLACHTADAGGLAVVEQAAGLAMSLAGQARLSGAGPAALGVAVPGVVVPGTGQVEWAPNIAGWRNIDLGQLLSEAVGLPVNIGFDGQLATLGEHWAGAARGCSDLVCIMLGTGIGGGIISGGRLLRGAGNLAGCAGWMVTDAHLAESPQALARGMLESAAGGRALSERAVEMCPEWAPLGGEAVSKLVSEAPSDPRCLEMLERAANQLGLALASLVSVLNPEVVIVGGGLGLAIPLFREQAKRAIARYAQPQCARQVRVVSAGLGADAPLVGAARLALTALSGGTC